MGRLLVIAVLLVSTVVSPKGVRAQPAAGRDHVVIGTSAEPDVLNPLFASTPAARSVLATIFSVPVQRDGAWKLFPQGVQSLPSLRDGTWKLHGQAMTLVWKLKPHNWHDGRPVTCRDFSFGHRVAHDPDVPVVDRDLTNRIESVVCPNSDDGTEIVVKWKERYAYAHTAVTEHGALPQHILDAYYRKDAATLSGAPFGRDPRATIGNGAFRLVEWRRGRSLTVEAVPRHGIFGTPRIRRIIWRFMPDERALAAAMLAGTIDAISTLGISFDQALQLERSAAGRVRVFFAHGRIWEHIDFNLDNPLLRDVRVRRAIAHAINREHINRLIFEGKQPVSHTYLPPQHPGHSTQVDTYPFDPVRARAMLRAAGWSPGPDGILRSAAGQRLRLEIATTARHRVRQRVAQMIRQDLHDVGIELTIRTFPDTHLFGQIIGRRKFPALAMYAWVLSPTADCDQLYTSDGIPDERNGWAGQNYPGYQSDQMNRVCRAASREIDETQRNKLLRESAGIFALDLPALPLYVWKTTAAAKIGLRNYGAVDTGTSYETWNAALWAWE